MSGHGEHRATGRRSEARREKTQVAQRRRSVAIPHQMSGFPGAFTIQAEHPVRRSLALEPPALGRHHPQACE